MWFFPRKKALVLESKATVAEAALTEQKADSDLRHPTSDSLFAESASIVSDLHEHLLMYGGAGGVLPNRDPLLSQQQPDGAYARPYGLFEEAIDKDAHLAALLAQRKAALLAWERRVVPADDSPRARQIADFVEAALEGISQGGNAAAGGGFERDLSELLDAIAYGFAVSEVIWERRPVGAELVSARPDSSVGAELVSARGGGGEDGPTQGRPLQDGRGQAPALQEHVVPKELRSRHPRRFVFSLRPGGGFEPRLLTAAAPVEGEALPARKLLVFAPYGRHENPYGHPLLRSVWWLAWFKRHALKYWVMYSEKFGAPTAVLQYPLGATEREKRGYKRIIAGLQQETGLVVPEGVQLSLLEAQRSGTVQTYSELLRFCNEEMSKAILGQTLSVEAGERGARSLGEVHMAVREDIVRCDAQALMALVNGQLIPWIVELNFGSVGADLVSARGSLGEDGPTQGRPLQLPRWELSPPRRDDLALQLEIDRFFAERGLSVDETELYARYGRKLP